MELSLRMRQFHLPLLLKSDQSTHSKNLVLRVLSFIS